MKRGEPLKRYKRLSPRSKKREAEAAQRRVVVEIVQRRDKVCQAITIVPEVKCWGPLDVDEIIARSQWSAGYLDPTNCQLLCRAHHDWKHEHPEEARALGLSRSLW